MALKPLNSVGGFSVGEIPANVILANADIISNNLTVQKVANLGPIGNVKITGGTNGQVIITDGLGNLSFSTIDTSIIANGTSNVSIPTVNGNVNITAGGNTSLVVTPTGANVTGTLGVTGNLTAANANLGNLVTANFANLSSNLFVTDTANVGNLRTNNLLYANGQPWDLQEAAGSNTYIQYNLNNDFGASANFTYNDATQQLYVNGNANVTGLVKTNTEQLTSLLPTHIVYGNGSSFLVGSANFTFDEGTNLLTVTGNIKTNNANLGNLVTANYANLANDLVVQGNIANANNISVTNNVNAVVGNFSGNINSLNANLGNLAIANYVNVASNVTSNNVTVNLELQANTANFDGNVVMDQWLTVTDTANVGNLRTDNLLYANGQPWDLQEAAGSNTQIQYNDGLNNFGASANFTFDYATQTMTVTGNANVSNTINGNIGNFSGNVTASNFSTTGSAGNISGANVVSANTFVGGNSQVNSLLSTQIVYANSGNYLVGDNNFVWNSGSATLGVTGNANVSGTVNTANINSGTGNDLTLTANGFNTVLYANGVANFPGNVYAHTFFGNVNANVTITAANTSVLYSDNGTIAGATGFTFDKTSNIFSTPGNLDVAGNINVTGNASTIDNITIGNYTILGNGGGIQLRDDTNGAQLNWNNNNYAYVDNTGVHLETLGGGNVDLDNAGNVSMTGNLSVTGNIANANNITATNNIVAGADISANTGNIYATNFETTGSGGNITGANVVSANTFTGNLEASYANITGNTITNNLTVNVDISASTANFTGNVVLSGPNVTVNNYLSGNIANFSGNITAQNANLGNAANANYVLTSAIQNGSANIVLVNNGNIAFSPNLANVMVLSNVGVNVVGYVTANGNGTFGAVYSNSVTAQGGNLLLQSEQAGNTYVQLRAYGDGTIDVGSARISSLATPNASTDAATKQYVDDVAQGLNVHDACYTAAANTLAVLTGGTITYNNGTGGVGANLVLSGSPTANYLSANVFDGNTQAVVGSRILVYQEANAATNGIYVVDSATVLTRASDYNSVPEVEAGDFVFVEDGDKYDNTGWVQTSVVTTIGTDPILFTQFSGAGTYTAGPGLSLSGGQFSVNVDNLTTEISGGNVIVKASAQLTTPNIGAATGTSLDLTGNVLANNLNSNNKVTAVTLEASGNVLANFINANANLLVNNANINVALNGNTANFSGNVIVPNLTVNTTLNGSIANFSGNLTAANANLGNLATANYVNVNNTLTTVDANVTGLLKAANANVSGNLITNNLTVNVEFSGANANLSGNLVTNNMTVNLELAGATANFSGNVVTNNFISNGLANVGNLLVVGNVQSNLNPNANLTYSLGTSTQRWANIFGGEANISGNANVTGNISANNFTANILTANTQANIGNTQIVWGDVTTSSITANQTIATLSITGVTGVEWIVKGYDSSGAKYSMAIVTAVTDGTDADYSTFGTVNLGGTTGTLAVNMVGSNIELQVTPSSTNTTHWVTQFRTI